MQIVDRLDLPSGRYQLRAGVTSVRRQTSGSVYADLDVPDFSRDSLSLSGVALDDPRTIRVVSAEAEGRLPPVVPMTTRAFDRTAKVASVVEMYQSVSANAQPVVMAVTIRDDREQAVFTASKTIDAARFSASRGVPFRFELPLATLPTGEYLLTFDAKAGSATARRQVRFAVR